MKGNGNHLGIHPNREYHTYHHGATCNNCGKQGHLFHQCKLPIISYGIILFRKHTRGLEYLMIRRKDSFGYIDFIRGKYSPYNIYQIQNIVNEMSLSEKHCILHESFDSLWKNMWGEGSSNQYKNEEIASMKKMEIIRNGVYVNDEFITLQDIVTRSDTAWEETEWEFPKGRRNHKEKDLDCALREFQEETGIPLEDIQVIDNILPFEEIFIGTNHKSYKHKYFLACMSNNGGIKDTIHPEEDVPCIANYQRSEVSKMEWKTLEACLVSMRPYNLEKRQLIQHIHDSLSEYKLYEDVV